MFLLEMSNLARKGDIMIDCPPNHVLEPWVLEYNLCFTDERVYLHQVAAIGKVGSSFGEAKEDKSIQGVWDMIIPFGLLLMFSAHL